MARRESRPSRVDTAGSRAEKKKGGGMLAGLMLGLLVGLIAAAMIAWYLNGTSETSPFKPAQKGTPAAEPAPASPAPPADPKIAQAPSRPAPPAAGQAEPTARPKPPVDYTFYGILPGDKPAKPIAPPQPKELWWLQIAALKNPNEADRLKAKLSLIGLQVTTQQIQTAGNTLYRVRVGPYQREDDAFGDLDTLTANDFEARLLKEPVQPKDVP